MPEIENPFEGVSRNTSSEELEKMLNDALELVSKMTDEERAETEKMLREEAQIEPRAHQEFMILSDCYEEAEKMIEEVEGNSPGPALGVSEQGAQLLFQYLQLRGVAYEDLKSMSTADGFATGVIMGIVAGSLWERRRPNDG